MLLTRFDIKVVTRPRFVKVNAPQFECAFADFTGVVFTIAYLAMVFIVDPNHLVFPVLWIKSVEIIEEVYLPRADGLFIVLLLII